jgi:tetratricopeptide (TPR) repeat protein
MNEHEKFMTDLHRLIGEQEFESEDQLKGFLDSLVGSKMPTISGAKLGPKEEAQDLVFAAYDLSKTKGRKNIEFALELDPDCIEAYEYLGAMENSVEVATVFYEKGAAIGRRVYGGKYLAENKGMFWGLHETRPFMRCLSNYAECLYILDRVSESVSVLEELIELNPNDNQGVRDCLMAYLIELREDAKFKKYEAMYKNEIGAFSAYNRALYAFSTNKPAVEANKKMKKALENNPFVPVQILSRKPIRDLPNGYRLGSVEEAKTYASFAKNAWRKTDGAIAWLKLHASKQQLPNQK